MLLSLGLTAQKTEFAIYLLGESDPEIHYPSLSMLTPWVLCSPSKVEVLLRRWSWISSLKDCQQSSPPLFHDLLQSDSVVPMCHFVVLDIDTVSHSDCHLEWCAAMVSLAIVLSPPIATAIIPTCTHHASLTSHLSLHIWCLWVRLNTCWVLPLRWLIVPRAPASQTCPRWTVCLSWTYDLRPMTLELLRGDISWYKLELIKLHKKFRDFGN